MWKLIIKQTATASTSLQLICFSLYKSIFCIYGPWTDDFVSIFSFSCAKFISGPPISNIDRTNGFKSIWHGALYSYRRATSSDWFDWCKGNAEKLIWTQLSSPFEVNCVRHSADRSPTPYWFMFVLGCYLHVTNVTQIIHDSNGIGYGSENCDFSIIFYSRRDHFTNSNTQQFASENDCFKLDGLCISVRFWPFVGNIRVIIACIMPIRSNCSRMNVVRSIWWHFCLWPICRPNVFVLIR